MLYLGLESALDKTGIRGREVSVYCRGKVPIESLKTYKAVPRGHLEVSSTNALLV